MNFSNPNTQSFLHRRSQNITLSGVTTAKVTIAVTYGGSTLSFVAKPRSGNVSIDVAEIIGALKCRAMSTVLISTSDSQALGTLGITATDTDNGTVSASYPVCDGWFDGVSLTTNFLTCRQLVDLTFPGMKEYLSVFADSASGSKSVSAVIHKTDGSTVNASIGSASSSSPKLFTYDVSYDTMKSKAGGAEILGYDVIPNAGSTLGQRYLVGSKRSDMDCFIFRNRFGVFDTVTARGVQSKGMDYDISTVKAGRTLLETSNDSQVIFETNTGALTSFGQRNHWLDFFRSDERYVYRGGMAKKITVTDIGAKSKLSTLNAMTFSWQFADMNTGLDAQSIALEAW